MAIIVDVHSTKKCKRLNKFQKRKLIAKFIASQFTPELIFFNCLWQNEWKGGVFSSPAISKFNYCSISLTILRNEYQNLFYYVNLNKNIFFTFSGKSFAKTLARKIFMTTLPIGTHWCVVVTGHSLKYKNEEISLLKNSLISGLFIFINQQ